VRGVAVADRPAPPERTELAVHIDVKYAANVKPGDLVAGDVVPTAPTRPVQPIARAMRVESVEVIVPDPAQPRRKSYRFHWGRGLSSSPYAVLDQVLTIVGAEG
jgi:hypothetical protein